MRLRSCVPLAVGLVLALPAPGFSLGDGTVRITRESSGFDATARLRAGGSAIRVGGPVRCTAGGRIRVDVTLTQRSTGALARGTWTGRCRQTRQRWSVFARAVTGAFTTGQVTGCAAAAAANARRATDAVQWCKVVRLAP